MANYSATANAIYDPQAAAEETQAGAARDSSIAALTGQDATIDRSAATAKDTLTTGHQSNQAKIDQNNTIALDGMRSGLTDNEQNNESAAYLKGLTAVGDTAQSGHDTVAAQRTAATGNYNAAIQSIIQKYSGLKSGYVADMLNQDSQQAFQERMATQAANASIAAARAYSTPSAAAPTTSQMLSKYFAGYQPSSQGGKAFFTERSVIPQLMADSGMSYNDAAKAAYAYRKQVFNE